MFKKRSFLLVLIVLVGLLIVFITEKLIVVSVSADSYYVTKITYTDNKIDVHGGITNSSIRFTGFFTYRVIGDSLYIKPFYSVVTSSKHNGDFKIGIKVKNGNIKKIYIVGMQNNDLKQIWPEDN